MNGKVFAGLFVVGSALLIAGGLYLQDTYKIDGKWVPEGGIPEEYVYNYTQEELDELREIGMKEFQEIHRKYGVGYGESYINKALIEELKEEISIAYQSLSKKDADEVADMNRFSINYLNNASKTTVHLTPGTRRGEKGKGKYTTAKDSLVFDLKTLKVKDTTDFSGIATVGEPKSLIDWEYDVKKQNIAPAKEYDDFVNNLKNIDRAYKDGNSLSEELKAVAMFDNGGVSIKRGVFGYRTKQIEGFGKKKNSTNPLHEYLALRPDGTSRDYIIDKDTFIWNEINSEMMPEKYNYFSENKNYESLYYPIRTQKLGDNYYKVDIEIDRPLEITGMSQVVSYIQNKFNIAWNEYNDKGTNIIMQVYNKNDLTNGMFADYGIFPVNMEEATSYCPYSYYYEMMAAPWYPNEEAQVWVKDYFDQLKVAYDADERFSIFETIESLSNKYNVPYNDMESVIMSYYYNLFAMY